MYNKAIMIGNLTRDIELRYLQSGTAVATSSIATTRTYKVNGEKKEDTCFMDFTVWGKAAETFNQYCRKGSKMMLEGVIKQDNWVDQSGQKRSKHALSVDEFKFLDSKADAERKAQNSHQNNGQQQQAQQQSYQPQQQQPHYAYQDSNGASQTQQQQQHTQNYQQQQTQQQQQQSYQPQQQQAQQQQSYQPQQQQAQQQQSYQPQQQQAQQQARQMPNNENIPVIDIDDDEIPFNGANRA